MMTANDVASHAARIIEWNHPSMESQVRGIMNRGLINGSANEREKKRKISSASRATLLPLTLIGLLKHSSDL
jgi:hypothetical protein